MSETKIAVYSRKSRLTATGESIANQKELCRDYIRFHYGEESISEILEYEDEGFSGKDLNRPDFKRMMAAAREGKLKAIVVYRLDRISRNISDFSGLIEELTSLKVDFVSIKEQFDTGTPMGRAMMYIASVFSQLERETIAERIKDNMHELAKTGRWLGGTTPTGYCSVCEKEQTQDGKTAKICHLKLVPGEAETVEHIYALYLQKKSLTAVEEQLNKEGIVTKNGRPFSRFSIRAILQNPAYLKAEKEAMEYFVNIHAQLCAIEPQFDGVHGMLVYNRTLQQKGKTSVLKPKEQWIVTVGRHPGIISAKNWILVQNFLDKNKKKKRM